LFHNKPISRKDSTTPQETNTPQERRRTITTTSITIKIDSDLIKHKISINPKHNIECE